MNPLMSLAFTDAEPEEAASVDHELVLATLIAVLSAEPSARGLWRAWHVGVNESAVDVEPRPVYVVEADIGGSDTLTANLHGAIERIGAVPPRVELTAPGTEGSAYQRMARAHGSIVWAAAPEPALTVARTFDGVDSSGEPFFAPDRRKLDADERDGVLGYLRAARTILSSPSTMRDIVDSTRGSVVPANFRSDGRWIWPDTVEYYLQQHQLAPDARLLAHVHGSGPNPPRLDAVAVHRAVTELYRPR